jgi:hypothetical protein
MVKPSTVLTLTTLSPSRLPPSVPCLPKKNIRRLPLVNFEKTLFIDRNATFGYQTSPCLYQTKGKFSGDKYLYLRTCFLGVSFFSFEAIKE